MKQNRKISSFAPKNKSHAKAVNGKSNIQNINLKKQRWVSGNHAVLEVLSVHPRSILKVIFQQGWQGLHLQNEIYKKVKTLAIEVEEKPKGVLDKLFLNHQGCLVLVEGRPKLLDSNLTSPSQLLFLDGIEDPHNLGAICRTSWLLGVQGIFIPEDRAVDITPAVHKVACGGVEHVPISVETQFKTSLEKFKEMGYWVFGLSHQAQNCIFELEIPKKVIWCVGAEDKGLRGSTEKLCDDFVSIPQVSSSASYNASVAAGLVLSEGYRQHNYASGRP